MLVVKSVGSSPVLPVAPPNIFLNSVSLSLSRVRAPTRPHWFPEPSALTVIDERLHVNSPLQISLGQGREAGRWSYCFIEPSKGPKIARHASLLARVGLGGRTLSNKIIKI